MNSKVQLVLDLHLPISEDTWQFENRGKNEKRVYTRYKPHFIECIMETDNENHIGIMIELYIAIAIFC